MLVSVKQAAIEFAISEQTIRSLIRQGKIPFVRLSPKTTRVDLSHLRLALVRAGEKKKNGHGAESAEQGAPR